MSTKPMSIEQSAAIILGLLHYAPAGYRSPFLDKEPARNAAANGSLDIRWEREGWGLYADMNVHWRFSPGKPNVIEVEVKWGSTTYTPGAAVAAAKLHREVAEFACHVEHVVSKHVCIRDFTADLPEG